MKDLRTKVAYLHGLADGLELEASSPEGRILSSMLDVLSDMADQITEIKEAQGELTEYIEDVDYDLGELEESIYGHEDDEEPEPVAGVVEEEDGVITVTCPSCGETVAVGAFDEDRDGEVVCPVCDAPMSEEPAPDAELPQDGE
ncbi:MAG TPA: AraC family transcriptional regulator [Symbiobacteriaceae bacterium]